MHESVMKWVKQVTRKLDLSGKSVLEVGSYNVNGSVRGLNCSRAWPAWAAYCLDSAIRERERLIMKWEYLITDLEWEKSRVYYCDRYRPIDEIGEEGWELVSVTQGGDSELAQVIFKRPKLEATVV